jgi:hypothetical protein
MIRNILLSAATCLLVASSGAQETGPLKILLNVRKSFAAKKNVAEVILVNTGDAPITVFSKVGGQSLDLDKNSGRCTLLLGFGTTKANFQGHALIASKYQFLPVTLRPGEATKCQLLPAPFRNPFARLPTGTKELVVRYAITPEFGERYGVWHGEATSKTLKVVNEEIQAE